MARGSGIDLGRTMVRFAAVESKKLVLYKKEANVERLQELDEERQELVQHDQTVTAALALAMEMEEAEDKRLANVAAANNNKDMDASG